jgi:hypothetical protein
LERAVSFEGYEFSGAFSIDNDSSGSSRDVDPTRRYREIEKIRLIDVDGNVYGHVGHAIRISVTTS